MARPCKAVDTLSRHNTKAEIEARKEQENKLKGLADKIIPPTYLNENQASIFYFIVNELKESGILSNLDIYILTSCAIAVDRLQKIEKNINKNSSLLLDKDLMSTKDKYTKDFFRCCSELSLSPQARAKIGNLNLQAKEKEEDPVLKALREDDEE